MDYRKAGVLAAAAFSLLIVLPQPAAAKNNMEGSVLTQEEREFTRQRQLHGNYAADELNEKAGTTAEKVSPKTKSQLPKESSLSKNSSYRETMKENSGTKAAQKPKKNSRSVLTPEEQQFTRARQENMNNEETQVPVYDSGLKNTADYKSVSTKGTNSEYKSAPTKGTNSDYRPASTKEVRPEYLPAPAKETKSEHRISSVKETPVTYKPQYLLPGDFKALTIFGPAIATEEQAVAVLQQVNPQPKLECSPKEIVHYYWEEAGREGIRPDVAFAQAIVETGSFRFGGDVHPNQNNFCGLGTVGGGHKGASFKSPELGVRAHIQHLLAYTDQRPRTPIIDPRYEMAHKVRQANGFCITWTQLNGTWAMGGYYAEKIMTVWERMLNNKSYAGVPVQSDVLAYGKKGR